MIRGHRSSPRLVAVAVFFGALLPAVSSCNGRTAARTTVSASEGGRSALGGANGLANSGGAAGTTLPPNEGGIGGAGEAGSGGEGGRRMPGDHAGGATEVAHGGMPENGGAGGGHSDDAFALDFASRARLGLAAAAPPWTCATALPTVPVADTADVRNSVRDFIARVMAVSPGDITMNLQPCGTSTSVSCAATFAHDTAKSGGAIYDATEPLARELEANATEIEETIWVATQAGMTLPATVVISGISDGLLVGMVVFNEFVACE